MDSVIEQQRYLHEERERLVEAMAHETMRKKTTHAQRLASDHKVKKMLQRHSQVTERLLEIYADRDGMRHEEIRILSHNENLNEFDARLRGIREYYRRRPDTAYIPVNFLVRDMFDLPADAGDSDSKKFPKQNAETKVNAESKTDTTLTNKLLPDFTDEEGGGRYLDLVQLHEMYINLPHIGGAAATEANKKFAAPTSVDYVTYLRSFDHLFEIGRDSKLSTTYRDYLTALLRYLKNFVERVKPLHDTSKTLAEADDDTKTKWSNGTFPGWEWYNSQQEGGVRLDLSRFRKEVDLRLVGVDRLKSALKALGMKCSGTVEQRASRLWQTKFKSLKDLDEKLFVNNKAAASSTAVSTVPPSGTEPNRFVDLALLEGRIYKLVESLLADVRRNTIENVQRKQARTADEREAEQEEEDEMNAAAANGANDDDDDDTNDTSGILYNPKNLPLGWDNKPIPYWLYKLHGLNLHYKCEICGNQEYRGPKVFQQHFTEWRHAHGMRCLGIPNSAHFHNVTNIDDALSLWDKLKQDKKKEQFKTDVEEEFEDSTGNVVSKKMFDDLRRQGLL